MDSFWLVLFLTVVLHSLDASSKQATDTATLESFARQNRARRFLRITEDGNNQFRLSFTGRQGELGTTFIWKKKLTASNVEFTLHTAGIPDFILCADKGKLVVKNSSRVDMAEKNCKLETRRVTLQYSDSSDNSRASENYEILVFQSKPRAVIKTSRSGSVFLDKEKNWKDSQAWFKITIFPRGGLPHGKFGDARRKV